jgi:hypothetical protein
LVEPVLDAEQRAVAAQAVSRLHLGEPAINVSTDGLTRGHWQIAAVTWVDANDPWRSTTEVEIQRVTRPSVSGTVEPFAWPEGFAPLDAQARGRWASFCRDDATLRQLLGVEIVPAETVDPALADAGVHRWSEGEFWLSCNVTAARARSDRLAVAALLHPESGRVIWAEVTLGIEGASAEALDAVVEELIVPLLSPEQATRLRNLSSDLGSEVHVTRDGARHIRVSAKP